MLWLDGADFLEYFRHAMRPGGIQRVEMEIFAAAERQRAAGAAVGFCRVDPLARRVASLPYLRLAQAFITPPAARQKHPIAALAWLHRERQKFRDTRAQWRWSLRHRLGSPRRAITARDFRPGDSLICLGTSWEIAGYAEALAALKQRYGLRILVLVHDIIPVTHPHWALERTVARFGPWLERMLAVADLALAPSHCTRDAVLAHAAAQGRPGLAVATIPFGAGFRLAPAARSEASVEGLPPRFVLCVGTIEVRKNHRLLVALWQRLIARYGSDRVPPLVLIGSPGWLVEELMATLAATRWLGGKILLRSDLDDAAVADAYRRALFTVYPSLMEGWGLPIAESLVAGKLCVAARRASLPEVGGDCVDYFDPENEDEALAALERALFDDAYRQEREAHIRAAYRPPSWSDCWAAIAAAAARAAPP